MIIYAQNSRANVSNKIEEHGAIDRQSTALQFVLWCAALYQAEVLKKAAILRWRITRKAEKLHREIHEIGAFRNRLSRT